MTPSTAAGRALLAHEFPEVKAEGMSRMPGFRWQEYDLMGSGVERIEAEAAAAERVRLAEAVRGLTTGTRLKRKAQFPESSYDPLLRESAVLALLDPQP